MLGERLAHDCAAQQEAITSDASARRFLSAQTRQEGFHAQVFQKAITWLAPRGINRSPGFAPIEQYRDITPAHLLVGDEASVVCVGGEARAWYDRSDYNKLGVPAPVKHLLEVLDDKLQEVWHDTPGELRQAG